MYFYTQLRQLFFHNILSYATGPDQAISELRAQDNKPKETNGSKTQEEILAEFDVTKDEWGKLNKENQSLVLKLATSIGELNESLEGNKLDAKFLKTSIRILDKVETDPSYKPTAPEDQKAYKEILDHLHAFQTKLSGLEKTNAETIAKISALKTQITTLTHGVENILGDRTEKEYSPEVITNLETERNLSRKAIRDSVFAYIGIPDNGKKLSELATHEKVQALVEEDAEGVTYGYDLTQVFSAFDAVENTSASITDVTDKGQELDHEIAQLVIVKRDLDISLRDIKKVEGDKILGEVRLDSVHASYDAFVKDATPEQKKIITENVNGKEEVTNFGDLTVAQYLSLQKSGLDIRKLIMTTPAGKPFEGGNMKEGESYIVNFGGNTEAQSILKMIDVDHNLGSVEIDGITAEFSMTGLRGPGYYSKEGSIVDMKDGSLLKILSTDNKVKHEVQTALDALVTKRKEGLISDSVGKQVLARVVRDNPDASFDVESLPGGLFGAIVAWLSKMLVGKQFEFNKETGRFELRTPTGNTPLTNREMSESVIQNGHSLGSLSAHYESGSRGPHAYNPNDNGHGPSYGSYQMNTNVGVYRAFIKKHGMSEGQSAWNMKIAEVGVEKFRQMEHQFIKERNYDPMMAAITLPGKEKMSLALQNVIWSSAVQHGPYKKSLINTINSFGSSFKAGDRKSEAQVINAIYDKRGRLYRPGIATRYNDERRRALAMLNTVPSGEMYNVEIDDAVLASMRSHKAIVRRNSKGNKMTYCSETARKNMEHIGIPNISRGDARVAFNNYPKSRVSDFPPTGGDAKVADLYLDASRGKEEFGHRATAIKTGGRWYVLDPYYKIPGYTHDRQGKIPAEAYLAHMKGTLNRKIWGAVYFGSSKA